MLFCFRFLYFCCCCYCLVGGSFIVLVVILVDKNPNFDSPKFFPFGIVQSACVSFYRIRFLTLCENLSFYCNRKQRWAFYSYSPKKSLYIKLYRTDKTSVIIEWQAVQLWNIYECSNNHNGCYCIWHSTICVTLWWYFRFCFTSFKTYLFYTYFLINTYMMTTSDYVFSNSVEFIYPTPPPSYKINF